MIIGIVIVTSDSPSLEKIEVILEKDSSLIIERGQFVTIPKNEKIEVIGLISGIKKYNAYYETLEASAHEIASRDYHNIFPINEWENTIAEIKPLGELDIEKEVVSRVKYPVSPGSKVFRSSPHSIEVFLGLDKNGLHLGFLQANEVDIKLNISRLLRKHLAILAISGAGKSYAASVLLEEILQYGKLGVILIDPHGEYSNIFNTSEYKENIEVLSGSLISIGVPELSAWDISEFIPEMSVVQTRVLEGIITNIKKMNLGHYSILELIKQLEITEGVNPRTREAMVGWLLSLHRTYLFSPESNLDFQNLISPGKTVILDLSDLQSFRARRIQALYFLKSLYSLRIQNKIPPIVFMIEEAHQFCPESSRSVSKGIIETIAREGRKFYCSLCLISQRPVNLSVTALSQCNSNLILRIRNPYDLDFIGKTSEGIDRSILKMLPDLEVGEALIVGEGINYPIFFRIRARKHHGTSISPNLQQTAESYAKKWQFNNSVNFERISRSEDK